MPQCSELTFDGLLLPYPLVLHQTGEPRLGYVELGGGGAGDTLACEALGGGGLGLGAMIPWLVHAGRDSRIGYDDRRVCRGVSGRLVLHQSGGLGLVHRRNWRQYELQHVGHDAHAGLHDEIDETDLRLGHQRIVAITQRTEGQTQLLLEVTLAEELLQQ